MATDETPEESPEANGLDSLRREMAQQMASLSDEIHALSDRVRALESRRQVSARTIAVSVLFVLFLVVPIIAVSTLIYYMNLAP